MAHNRTSLVADIMSRIPDLRAFRTTDFCAQPFQRDISLPQLQILLSLAEENTSNISELARMFGVSMPSASAIVDRMEERGLVLRERHSTDRRVVTVGITSKGREVAEEFMGLKREQFQRVLDVLTLDELQDVHTGLAALISGASRLQADRVEVVS